MNVDRILRAGDEVRIQGAGGAFVTRAGVVVGETSFTVEAPENAGCRLLMKSGARLLVSCATERGLYLFEAAAGGTYHAEGGALTLLTVVGNVRKFQRRDAFRVRESVPVKARKKPREGEEPGAWAVTSAIDISEGGMLLKFSEACQRGELLELIIGINQFGLRETLPKIEGEVVRCTATGGVKFGYSVGLRFRDLSEKTRGTIIKLVTLSQRTKLTYRSTKRGQ